jgi:hypothetical protein
MVLILNCCNENRGGGLGFEGIQEVLRDQEEKNQPMEKVWYFWNKITSNTL